MLDVSCSDRRNTFFFEVERREEEAEAIAIQQKPMVSSLLVKTAVFQ